MNQSLVSKNIIEDIEPRVLILGGIDRTREKKCFLIMVPNQNRDTLIIVIKDNIHPGSIEYTDLWRSYNTLDREGYFHKTISYSLCFKETKAGVHTNTI